MSSVAGSPDIAIFDVCHTLFKANTTAGFISHLQHQHGNLKQRLLVQLIRNRLSPVRYAALFYSKMTKHDAPRDILISTLAGYSEIELRAAARVYTENLFAQQKIPQTHVLLAEAKDAGARVVLVSNSLDIVIQAIAERFDCESVASKLAIKDGVCQGRLSQSLTGKKHIAIEDLLKTPGANITVCTDNRSDAELLRQGTRRIVVHSGPPAEELKQLATEFIDVE